jgi:hypothetical protein
MGVRWEKSESRTCYAQATWRLWLTLILVPQPYIRRRYLFRFSDHGNTIVTPLAAIVHLTNRQLTDLYSHELDKNQGIVVRFPVIDRVITRVAFIGDRKLSVQIEMSPEKRG